MLQRARKAVLSDWVSESYLVDYDEVFSYMALKGIVNVAGAGGTNKDLNSIDLSPIAPTNPDDGMPCALRVLALHDWPVNHIML